MTGPEFPGALLDALFVAAMSVAITAMLVALWLAVRAIVRRRRRRRRRYAGPPPPVHFNCRCTLRPTKRGDL